jgi:toxin ParE1/3/4
MAKPRSRPVLWTRLADRDLEQILDYVATQNPRAAARLIDRVLNAVALLGENPEMGPVALLDPPGRYRQMLLERYLIVYRVDPKSIFLMRFWDTRQDPARLSAMGEE